VLHSILFVYVDGENRTTQTDAYIYDLIVPLDITLVLAFILGAAVVSTLGKYLVMRNSIRTSVEAICGCLQNIAMIISTMDLDDDTRFRRYCQLNAIHFLSFTAASMDKRYDDIEGLYNVNLITRKEYEVLKKPFITKKKLALLKRFYREVLTDMKNTNQQEDRLLFTQLCGTLRAKMGGGGLKLATQLYPPPAHAAMNRGCAYTFLFLLPVMCWEANSGHISNWIAIAMITLYVNLVLKLMANSDLLDYDPTDPEKQDTYAFNPDTYLLNTEVALWTLLYSDDQDQAKSLGNHTSFLQMENALNAEDRVNSDMEASVSYIRDNPDEFDEPTATERRRENERQWDELLNDAKGDDTLRTPKLRIGGMTTI